MPQKCEFSSEKKKSFPVKLIFADSGRSADLLYASGFHAADPFIYFETPERKGILVSSLEYSRAVEQRKKDVEVLEYSRILSSDTPKSEQDPLLALARYLSADSFLVPEDFPLAKARLLEGKNCRIECASSGSFFPERERKSQWEVEKIEESVKAAEEAMQYLRSLLAEAKVNSKGVLELASSPLTSEFLLRELEGNFKKNGYSATHTIVAHGIQCASPHNSGSGPILAGECIVADIFPRSDSTGYWGDMTRTFVKGKAPAIVKKAYKAVKDASNEAFAMLRPGISGALVHNRAQEVMRRAGFETGKDKNGFPCGFIHSLGHGVGLEIHEGPRLSPYNALPLRPGNVVSVEPGLYYQEWGGIRLEDLALITLDGVRNLNTMEMELEIP